VLKCGITVSPRSEEEIRDAIVTLATNEVYQEKKKQCEALTTERSWTTVAREVEVILQTV